MTYLHLKKKIPRAFDRRVKLTEEDKEDIRNRFKKGEGIREIARTYEKIISRRMIQFILFPERLQKLVKKHIQEKSHLKYYDKNKWRETMREHRHYKQELYLSGKLK